METEKFNKTKEHINILFKDFKYEWKRFKKDCYESHECKIESLQEMKEDAALMHTAIKKLLDELDVESSPKVKPKHLC